MAVKTIEPQLPIFSAFCTLDVLIPALSLIRTNKVPMIENKIPMPAISIGNRIGRHTAKGIIRHRFLAKYHRCQNSSYIRTKKIGTHTGNITDVITYVIGNGSRVTWIIFRNACFYFTNQVGTYIGSFCIDTAAHTGKKCNRFSTQGRSRSVLQSSVPFPQNSQLHPEQRCDFNIINKPPRPRTARPATPSPITEPPVKETFSALLRLVRAACAVRTLAFVATRIPI